VSTSFVKTYSQVIHNFSAVAVYPLFFSISLGFLALFAFLLLQFASLVRELFRAFVRRYFSAFFSQNRASLPKLNTDEFDFELPQELIAQLPLAERDGSRLLVLDRGSGKRQHRQFQDLVHYLTPGEVLVLNNSRVIPARLRGINANTGGEFELLLLEQNALNDWWVMVRPGKRARTGTQIILRALSGQLTQVTVSVLEKNSEGHCRVHFNADADIMSILDRVGEVPLPP